MPRVSKAQTELNYRRILEVTAARIREAGVDKVSVSRGDGGSRADPRRFLPALRLEGRPGRPRHSRGVPAA
jgi:hypothetical protein